jgi:hypothetical protein
MKGEFELNHRPYPRAALVATRLFVAVSFGIIGRLAVIAAGDPDGSSNLAANSPLPRGPGVAAAYPGDRGIAAHSAVIFADNFEPAAETNHWDSARNDGGRVLSWVDAAKEDPRLGHRSLKVTAMLGANTGGGLTRWFEPADPIHIRFYVKFDPECDFVHHFCTLRANKSLQGSDRWSGFGGAGLQPNGDERFSTALEPWGNWGRWTPPGRWNFYSYWHTMSASPDGKFWGNAFRPATADDIQRGKWICAEFMLKHNSPGQADGEQAFWIDGELEGHWKGINWRKSPTLWANALTLESYITDRWTRHPTNIVFFDNLVVARQYIGPAQMPAE